MPRKYTRYTKELLEPVVSSSKSYSECLDKLGLVKAGGNYKNLQKNIDKFKLCTEHMTHQLWSKGREIKPYEDLISTPHIKKRLIRYRGHVCESCNSSEWMGKPIPLELEHINGDNRDHSEHNLKLLCCNCHALTPTWRNRTR